MSRYLLLIYTALLSCYLSAAPINPVPETEPESEQLPLAQKLQDKVPSICTDQCSVSDRPWLGRIILQGQKKSVDYKKAALSENTDYRCICRSVQTSVNDDPVWSHNHALTECPDRCSKEIDEASGLPGMVWTGHWWTTEWGRHSVCQCASRKY